LAHFCWFPSLKSASRETAESIDFQNQDGPNSSLIEATTDWWSRLPRSLTQLRVPARDAC